MTDALPDERYEGNLDDLMATLGYVFSEPALLLEAVTHASFRNEHRTLAYDNERFEFLGDSVLGAVVSHLLIVHYPDEPEGVLTRYKAVLVSEQGLGETSESLKLGQFLRLGRGEELTGGRAKASMLANAVEAIVAAVFLDGGFDAAASLIKHLYGERIAEVGDVEERIDFKTKLQEWVQLQHHVLPDYCIINIEGPDHQRIYSADVSILGECIASGSGRSKKEAEQRAAENAYLAVIEADKTGH